MSGFLTLAGPSIHRVDVKKSVFVALAARADSAEQVAGVLRGLAAEHADASHLCWAYRIGQQYRFSDGGEPGGTAGQPILRAIDTQGLDHVVVGVIRYFGGVKLGAGGLARAYGGAAAEALRRAERSTEVPTTELLVRVPFDALGTLHHVLSELDGERVDEAYDEAGVRLRVRLRESDVDRLADRLRGATRDAFRIEVESSDG